jgi:HK97 gp10 family phage protein
MPAKVVKIWHGKRIVEILQSELTRRLTASAMLVTRHAKELVGKEGTGVRSKGGGVEPSQPRNKKKLKYGAFPSSPGEPPRKQTGRLQGSITWELSRRGLFGRGLMARVGTNVDYGRYLELGTRRMRPRPWLKRSLDAVKPQIKMILSRPMRGPDRGR